MKIKKIKVAAFPKKKYTVIYADPPWPFGSRTRGPKTSDPFVSIATHYPTMSVKEICALPISQISNSTCACLLWVPDAFLDEGIQALKSWGFKYKTVAFVWSKITKNGKQVCNKAPYTMKNCELVLLGTRGPVTKLMKKRNVRQLQIAIRPKQHSAKPDEIRNKIVEMFGKRVKRIELFARKKSEGWDSWGNEIK